MTRAQINLALVLVAAGPGARDSLVEAWAWFSLAAARGEEHAQPLADDLGAKLDTAEKVRAEAALEKLKADVPAR
jgi:TPR repeat protein